MLSSMPRGLWKLLPILGLLSGPIHPANAQPAIVGPTNAIICTTAFQSAFTGAPSNFTIVASATAPPTGVGKGIYICGWSASTNNTNVSAGVASQTTFQLFTTSGSCQAGGGSSSIFITPSHGVTATAPVVDHIDYAFLQAAPTAAASPANQLCLATGGNGNDLRIIVYFAQF